MSYSCSVGSQRFGVETGRIIPQSSSLWEVQAIAFTMLGEAINRVGSSFPSNIWQSTIQMQVYFPYVFRKVMDLLASMRILVEDNVMCRFYAPLLSCLHLVLMDPKVLSPVMCQVLLLLLERSLPMELLMDPN